MPRSRKLSVRKSKDSRQVGYAVVGLGYFAQASVLPAFAHAKNSRLAALVSDDPEKLKQLARKYGVEHTYSYREYQQCLANEEVDAVYIVLPNDLHRDFAVRAARMGIHVLVEKPMAVTEKECEEMIREAREHDVRLMVAYRLHLQPGNLQAIKEVRSGKIGNPRFFDSTFSMQVKGDNIRTKAERGGGPVYDLGVYCINAARYMFQDEPYEVTAFNARGDDPRFREVDEMVSAVLRFPENRLATLTCSFGAADTSAFSVVGTKGDLCLDSAFEVWEPPTHYLTVDGKTRTREFPRTDQVAAELIYFADCVLKGKQPEPSGEEGLADVRIIQAIHDSVKSGKAVKLERLKKRARPSPEMELTPPPSKKQRIFHAQAPHD